MLKKADQLLAKSGATNVSFVESPITDISLPDQTADCIISNCVINLVPESEKQLVFNECFRLLKPGGRFAVSDILAKKDLPPHVKDSMALYVGCIAGASQVAAYEKYLREAGFRGNFDSQRCFYRRRVRLTWRIQLDILIVDTNSDLNIYTTAASNGDAGPCCPPSSGCCPPSSNGEEVNRNKISDAARSDDVKNLDFNEFAGEP